MPSFNPGLTIYMNEIAPYSVLSAQEEKMMFLQIRKGSSIARETVIQCNLRLVIKIAKSFLHRGLDYEDLIAEGNLGLFRALKDFDSNRNTRFATYATWWIKEAIHNALLTCSQMVRLPTYMSGLLRKWKKTVENLKNKSSREPSVDEIAKSLKLNTEKVQLVQRAIKVCTISAGQCRENEENTLKLDIIEDKRISMPETNIFDESEKDKLLILLKVLPPKEASVLKMRFGVAGQRPLTLKEAGLRLGVSLERIRQLENQAIKHLRLLFKKPLPRRTA